MVENIYSRGRKQGQQKGTIPLWYTSGGYQLFCEKYLHQDTIRKQYELIAATAAQHLKNTKWALQAYDRFFNLLWFGWLSSSTPILANMGTDRGLPVSCSGGYIHDSIDGFYTSRRETAILTKYGFGTSGYLGDIRPRGAPYKGGKASGALPVLKGFVRDMDEVAQGARRGAWAGYLPIDHADFDEVCDLIHHSPDGLNVGWNISDEFTRRLDEGGKEELRRYQKALKTKMITGKGYFFFVDKANRHRPQEYIKNNLDIKASNLCVAPETLVLTDKGHLQICELEGQFVNIWNGEEWSEVVVNKTGINQPVISITTDSGFNIDCTPYHKFYVKNDYHSDAVEKRGNELCVGDKLIKVETPVIEGGTILSLAYQNGFFSGDGCRYGGKNIIYLYHDKRKLVDKFVDYSSWHYAQELQNREILHVDNLKEKFFVPTAEYTVDSRLNWLAGLLDSDGTVARAGLSQTLQIGSTQLGFLKQVQLMLQTLGVQSKITKMRDAGNRLMPKNDGTGECKEYFCKASYRLLISGCGIIKLLDLGLNTLRLNIEYNVPDRNAERFIKITSIIDSGRTCDTYCFNEPKQHKGIFNGLLTGNCSEIMLHSSEEYTYTCVLSSMNLAKYDEWKDTDAVYWATLFLDCVASEFIEKARNIPGLEKAVAFTEKGRALGLGVCGFHTLLQKRRVPFESLEAQFLNTEIFKLLKDTSVYASLDLARELGSPKWCGDNGKRNTHLLAVAPTKSTALIMGGISEGINPDPAMTYTQTTTAGEIERINPILLEIMKERNVYDDKHIEEVVAAFGSVQNVNWLTDEEKLVFKTAFEIDQNVIVRLAAQRQKYIDQGQSVNLFFAGEAPEEYISSVHKEAFKNKDILSLYYCYSNTNIAASIKNECQSCM